MKQSETSSSFSSTREILGNKWRQEKSLFMCSYCNLSAVLLRLSGLNLIPHCSGFGFHRIWFNTSDICWISVKINPQILKTSHSISFSFALFSTRCRPWQQSVLYGLKTWIWCKRWTKNETGDKEINTRKHHKSFKIYKFNVWKSWQEALRKSDVQG